MICLNSDSTSKSVSLSIRTLKEALTVDLKEKFGSASPGGIKSPTYYRQQKESMIMTLPSLTRSSNDPNVQRELDDFTTRSGNSKKLMQIVRSSDFSIHDNPANVCRKKNMFHRECVVLFMTEVFPEKWRNIRYACCIADFLMETPNVPEQEIICLRDNRPTMYTTHKKIRIRQIVNTLCELGHIDDEMKGHLIGWYESDPDNIANMTSLYIQPNVHRVYLEANHIPVRDVEMGCPLFVFLKPYFDQREGVNSPGLKIVKEMSTRFFDSYHI